MEDAINSFINGVNIISSEWDDLNKEDLNEDDEIEKTPLETNTDSINDEIFSNTGTIDSETQSKTQQRKYRKIYLIKRGVDLFFIDK